MGVAALGALVAILLAFLAQSPRLLTRFKLSGRRLDLRARSFTGYGLALLLLAVGFFLAGVPLDRGEATASATDEPALAATESAGTAVADIGTTDDGPAGGQSGAMVGLPTPDAGGASGAMSGLITPQATLEPGAVLNGDAGRAGDRAGSAAGRGHQRIADRNASTRRVVDTRAHGYHDARAVAHTHGHPHSGAHGNNQQRDQHAARATAAGWAGVGGACSGRYGYSIDRQCFLWRSGVAGDPDRGGDDRLGAGSFSRLC